MQWSEWIEKVFHIIVSRYLEEGRPRRDGIVLYAELMLSDEEAPAQNSFYLAFRELCDLGLLEKLVDASPPSARVTVLGMETFERGMAVVLAPRILAAWEGLSPLSRRLLVQLVESVETVQQPDMYALRPQWKAPELYKEVVGHWDGSDDRDELEEIVKQLMAALCAECYIYDNPQTGNTSLLFDREIWPLYLGFQSVRQTRAR